MGDLPRCSAPCGCVGLPPDPPALVCRVPLCRVFNADAQGSLADAGVAEGGGAAFFLEPKAVAA